MSTIAYSSDVREIEAVSGREAGSASRRIVASYGFWIFLLSDIVEMFLPRSPATLCWRWRPRAVRWGRSSSIKGA